jgi:hypothetical protein
MKGGWNGEVILARAAPFIALGGPACVPQKSRPVPCAVASGLSAVVRRSTRPRPFHPTAQLALWKGVRGGRPRGTLMQVPRLPEAPKGQALPVGRFIFPGEALPPAPIGYDEARALIPGDCTSLLGNVTDDHFRAGQRSPFQRALLIPNEALLMNRRPPAAVRRDERDEHWRDRTTRLSHSQGIRTSPSIRPWVTKKHSPVLRLCAALRPSCRGR